MAHMKYQYLFLIFILISSCSSYRTYTIVRGDTLSGIAKRFGTTYQEIARLNGIADPNKIRAGQVIKIPDSSGSGSSGSGSSSSGSSTSPSSTQSYITYTIVRGDTLTKIANKFGTTYQELARINGISNPNLIKVGQVIKVPKSSQSSDPNPPSQTPSDPTPQQPSIGKNQNVLAALQRSQWSQKADSLAVAYNTIKSSGYSTECAIGLMANLVAEGNYGIVEYSFSLSHSYGFRLPSGGSKCRTIEDIRYVKSWTTSDYGSEFSKVKKGSCGFGSVQWSYDRRVNFANVCLSIMKKDSDVHDGNWAIAEATFIAQELKGGYYSSVKNAAVNAGGSVEAWAEAFTDKYERPSGADLNMSGTGSACQTRRRIARELYNYLRNSNAL